MSEADRRVEGLLERWLASVERHLDYLKLDNAAYARAEAWPKHQRPNAFVVQLAHTRLLELKAQLIERRDQGDSRFAESLELMSFLTGLLESEHIERFIPLATGKPPDSGVSATVEQPRVRSVAKPASKAPAATTPGKPAAGTPRRTARNPAPAAAAAQPRPAAAAPRVPASPARPAPASAAKDAMTVKVIADAVRMLEWGSEWPALAGLIARMADRPSETDVWKILRANRSEILAKAPRHTG
jgi:hypothetical protein